MAKGGDSSLRRKKSSEKFVSFLLIWRKLALLVLRAETGLLATASRVPCLPSQRPQAPCSFVAPWHLSFFSGELFAFWGETSLGLNRVQSNSGGTAQFSLPVDEVPEGRFGKPANRCTGREHSHRVMQLLHAHGILEGRRESSLRSQSPFHDHWETGLQGPDTLLRERRGAGPLCHFLCCHRITGSTFLLTVGMPGVWRTRLY